MCRSCVQISTATLSRSGNRGLLPPLLLSALRNRNGIHARSKFFAARFLHFHAAFPSSSFSSSFLRPVSTTRFRAPRTMPRDPTPDKSIFTRHNFHIVRPRAPPPPLFLLLNRLYTHTSSNDPTTTKAPVWRTFVDYCRFSRGVNPWMKLCFHRN